MQPRVPVARMCAVRLVSGRVMLLRVPAEMTWEVSARMTAKGVRAAPTMLIRTMLIQTRAASVLAPPGLAPSRIQRRGQAKAPPSTCREGP